MQTIFHRETLTPFSYADHLPYLISLQEIHRLLDRSFQFEDAVARVLTLLEERHNLQQSQLSLLDERTQEIRVTAAIGISSRARAQGRYQLGEGITGRVVQSGKPIIVPQVADEPLHLNRMGTAADDEARAFLCVPVQAQGRTLGALGSYFKPRQHEELNTVASFLSLVAVLIAQSFALQQTATHKPYVEDFQPALKTVPQKADIGSFIGSSNATLTVLEQALQVAAAKTTVLLRGESGTGKEVIADLIHRNSTRADQPFVKVNCGALPESLLETELFGHERGAFTGAMNQRKGRFELAAGGTIFLDEIGELTMSAQTRLLRVLQEREFERVGGTTTIKADVRLITATNKNLEAAITQGTFREDLYYRLNVFTIFLPPLRERKTDILLLADHFVEKYAREHSKVVKRISTPAIDMLMSYHWPGNVRELENCIERAVVVCDDAVIHGHHLPPTLQTAEVSGTLPSNSLNAAVASLEREMIIETLKVTHGNQARAANLLQITERIINYKVKKYGIDCNRFRE
ncbi:MAG TPA: sigma 54-interacting transcriptional regulator [Blastocatellia bacterium]|nr:sigma 54-interacting transcriptional regulator [Blastocatellia bacterium]